ncbi:cytidylyltransferase domain-containing protein [Arcobacter sp. LA11]|uniref:cytidylyltransferase domain-containing protein n=1 Tax=Arcobacter sp. LA11 TaxID=1898176 RepID=UPI000934A1A1|nr:glycosyltransferase family protein [Arcobacter sp. LA11]
MDKFFIIIQARMTSTRLPSKVMLPLCGKTVLEIMIDRLRKFKENIIIATTNDGTEKPIVELCKKLGIKYYEGDTSNVLSRYYEASLKYGVGDNDIIIRCTSDCPLIDQEILGRTLEFFRKNNSDYSSANQSTGFPRGLDTEVFRFGLLKKAYLNATTFFEKEHVTPYMYKTIKNDIEISLLKNKNDDSKYRLTLDEEDDYIAIKEIYLRLNNRIDFSYEELIQMLEENKYIYEINSHVEQKKG